MHIKIDMDFDKKDGNKEKILYNEEEIIKKSESVKRVYLSLKKLFKSYGINSTNIKQIDTDYKSFLREIKDYKNGVKLFGDRDIFYKTVCDMATEALNAFDYSKGIHFSTKLHFRILDERADVLERLSQRIESAKKKARLHE